MINFDEMENEVKNLELKLIDLRSDLTTMNITDPLAKVIFAKINLISETVNAFNRLKNLHRDTSALFMATKKI